jgi:hypothetical protein
VACWCRRSKAGRHFHEASGREIGEDARLQTKSAKLLNDVTHSFDGHNDAEEAGMSSGYGKLLRARNSAVRNYG